MKNTPTDLARHTSATLYVPGESSLDEVARFMGHKLILPTPRQIGRYYQLMLTRAQKCRRKRGRPAREDKQVHLDTGSSTTTRNKTQIERNKI
jgi:hypothetical protein